MTLRTLAHRGFGETNGAGVAGKQGPENPSGIRGAGSPAYHERT